MYTTVSDQRHTREAIRLVLVLCLCGLVVTALYGVFAVEDDAFAKISAVCVGLMVAGAFIVGGGFLGFLFGIPRISPTADSDESEQAKSKAKYSFSPNTNLEQISDWLTKILVGVGLAELGTISPVFQSTSDYIAAAFGGSSSDHVFAGALTIYSLIAGFVSGYVSTTLILPKALREIDQEHEDALAEVAATLETIEGEVDENVAEDVRERRLLAERQLGTLFVDDPQAKERIEEYARKYERLRRTLSPGKFRTHQMAKIVARVRAIAPAVKYSASQINGLFNTGKDGNRVVALALVKATHDPGCAEIVIESIEKSRSAFEQYHGLRAAEELLGELDDDWLRRIVTAIQDQRSRGRGKFIIPENKDRWALSERILKSIDDRLGGADQADE